MSINNGGAYANSVAVTVNSTVTGASEMRFQSAPLAGAWSPWEAYGATRPLTFVAGSGPRAVEGEYRDEAGNTIGLVDFITVDMIAPTTPTVTATTSPVLADGAWYFHLRVADNAGYPQGLGELLPETANRHADGGARSLDERPAGRVVARGDAGRGAGGSPAVLERFAAGQAISPEGGVAL